MSELRAPDPTLDALVHCVVRVDLYRMLPVAHKDSDGYLTPCGLSLDDGYDDYTDLADPELVFMGAEDARWLAVPCRDCFPDAPPPGHEASCPPYCQVSPEFPWAGPLAWQVQP